MSVIAGGPAEKAGIKPGDLLVSIDGAVVAGVDDLLKLLDHTVIGREVKVGIVRRGVPGTLTAVPVERGSR